MPQPVPSKFLLMFFVAVSAVGLALVPVLLLQPNLQADTTPLRRPLVSAVFSAICVLGIVAVFYPGKCRMMFKKPNISAIGVKPSASIVQLSGHHPDCEKFDSNRIKVGSLVFCAGCSGLLIGAIASMVAVVLFSLGFFGSETGSLWILVAGEVLMLLGLAQIKTGDYLKMAVNALFVVGSLLSLVAADLAAMSFLVDAYVLGLTAYMLWLRILLSEWKNKRKCLACGRCI
jgi:hypothetical protein